VFSGVGLSLPAYFFRCSFAQRESAGGEEGEEVDGIGPQDKGGGGPHSGQPYNSGAGTGGKPTGRPRGRPSNKLKV